MAAAEETLQAATGKSGNNLAANTMAAEQDAANDLAAKNSMNAWRSYDKIDDRADAMASDTVKGGADAIEKGYNTAKDKVMDKMEDGAEVAQKGYKMAKRGYEQVKDKAKQGYEAAKDNMGEGYEEAKDAAKDNMGDGYEKAKDLAKQGYEAVKDVAKEGYEAAKDTAKASGDKAESGLDMVKDMAHQLKDKVVHAYEAAKETVSEAIGQPHAADRLEDKAENLVDKAKDIMAGTAQGAKNMMADKAGTMVDKAKDAGRELADEAADAVSGRKSQTGVMGADSIDGTTGRQPGRKAQTVKGADTIDDTYNTLKGKMHGAGSADSSSSFDRKKPEGAAASFVNDMAKQALNSHKQPGYDAMPVGSEDSLGTARADKEALENEHLKKEQKEHATMPRNWKDQP